MAALTVRHEGAQGSNRSPTREQASGDAISGDVEAPRVSVIMIFLNEREFIGEAIASVLGQSLCEWELLLVDDGSTDGSTEIALEHARNDPARIRYLTHADGVHRGTGPSRELGLRAARGRYVAFLDADDVYLPQRLAMHVEILDRRADVDVVQSYHLNWLSWQSASAGIGGDYLQGPALPGEALLKPPAAMVNSLTNVDSAVGMDTITLRRDVALRRGGFEVQFTSLFEDQAFLTKLYLQHTVYLLPLCLARYRMHPRSTVQSAFASAHVRGGSYQQATRALADWQVGYVGASAVTDPLVHALISQRARGVGSRSLSWRGLVLYATGLFRRLLARLLPPALFAAVSERRRVELQRRALQDYLSVCDARARQEADLVGGAQ